MKYLLILVFIIQLQSCEEKENNCKNYCFNYIEPLRISYLDSNDVNLLDSSINHHIELRAVYSSTGAYVNFKLTNTIGGQETGFWFLESINRVNRPNCNDMFDCKLCVEDECELYIHYKNLPEIDTLNVLYEKLITVDNEGCSCINYPLKYININGELITEFNWEPNNTGAAIIRK